MAVLRMKIGFLLEELNQLSNRCVASSFRLKNLKNLIPLIIDVIGSSTQYLNQ
jgi:hypothetical protein